MPTTKPPQNQNLTESIVELRQQAIERRHRYLVLVSGERAWSVAETHRLVAALDSGNALWIGEDGPGKIPSRENAQALQHLGRELDLLIYNAFSGFHPDAFGALSGTLRGGGLLFLLTPPLSQWQGFHDPEYARITLAGYETSEISGHFLSRLAGILQQETSILRISPDQASLPMAESDLESSRSQIPPSEPWLTEDQHRAVEAIQHVATGHRKRPLVLSSDRGRGKSSALGIAAARLMLGSSRKILATAPRMSATESLFQQARRLLPDASSDANSLNLEQSQLRYSAPDHLLAQPQPADLLLVDEAAAIPTPILEALLKRYARVVFATTVHGYEGTGRGFSVRFKSHLDQVTPNWRELSLSEPIRWSIDDPLEPLVFNLLALDANPVPDDQLSTATVERVKLDIPDPERLCKNEDDLKQIFGLLVLAHYRTTPLDLRLLLDGPNLKTVLLRDGDAVAGVALLAAEGGFDEALADQIWAGHRRPRGHLLAQSLAAHVGVRSAPMLKGLRIMRIAIHPAVQRRGLGSRLINEIRHYASDRGFDYIGTSFGASESLIDFWHRNGLAPVRLGVRAGASSGGHSLLMIDPLTQIGSEMAKEAKARFAEQLPSGLEDSLSEISGRLVARLLATMPQAYANDLSDRQWQDLAGYAFARRGFEASLAAIERLALMGLSHGSIEDSDAELLIARVLQKQSWQSCSLASGLSGRGESENRMREIIAELIRVHDPKGLHTEIVAQIAPCPETKPVS
jgi:tRNA(Met) cytidine acetyltransferase